MGSLRMQEDSRRGFLLPPSPSDWLPDNHLVWFVIDAVEQIDIDHLLAELPQRRQGRSGWVRQVRGFCVRGLGEV